jgi:hypothetical protein
MTVVQNELSFIRHTMSHTSQEHTAYSLFAGAVDLHRRCKTCSTNGWRGATHANTLAVYCVDFTLAEYFCYRTFVLRYLLF